MTTKINYTSLKGLDAEGDYNFFGIIYDATFPTQDETPNNYVCTLKLIDQDINNINSEDRLEFEIINLIIKSNSKDNLPHIHQIGDIIRVHRGIYVYIINKFT